MAGRYVCLGELQARGRRAGHGALQLGERVERAEDGDWRWGDGSRAWMLVSRPSEHKITRRRN